MTGERVELEIEAMDVAGDGLATHRRRPIAVPFTIPGERVAVQLHATRAGVRAELLSVLRPSPHRIVPRCPHFGPDASPGPGPCGGCSWQHIAYPEQLRLKTALLDRLIAAAVRGAPAARPTLAATPLDRPWGYRHKVHFVFGNTPSRGAARLVMGHYVRGSRRIVPVRECPVHDERGNALAFRFRDRAVAAAVLASSAGSAPGARTRESGALRAIAIRTARHTSESLVTLVATSDADPRLRRATRQALMERDAPTGLHLNLHDRDDGYVFGRETRRLAGAERLREVVADARFVVSPTAFFQTNVDAAQRIVELVLEAVPAGARVIDLYAGAGLFALPLARRGHVVVAVEENRAAVADGEASARANRLEPGRCRFLARPVSAALASLPAADVVILDPPRQGCERAVLDGVFGRMQPERAVYVSCNPETLARDLALIAAHRYRIEAIQPVDMFPHTAHIESVVRLRRR